MEKFLPVGAVLDASVEIPLNGTRYNWGLHVFDVVFDQCKALHPVSHSPKRRVHGPIGRGDLPRATAFRIATHHPIWPISRVGLISFPQAKAQQAPWHCYAMRLCYSFQWIPARGQQSARWPVAQWHTALRSRRDFPCFNEALLCWPPGPRWWSGPNPPTEFSLSPRRAASAARDQKCSTAGHRPLDALFGLR